MTESESPLAPRSSAWSVAGLVIAFVALTLAVLSPWIVEALTPNRERKPMDDVAVDVATKIKDRLVAKAKGEEFVAEPVRQERVDFEKWYPPSVIGIGLMGACLGVVGFTRHENLRISASAVAVGLAAIVFQYFLILAATIITILLIGLIPAALGIDLPTP